MLCCGLCLGLGLCPGLFFRLGFSLSFGLCLGLLFCLGFSLSLGLYLSLLFRLGFSLSFSLKPGLFLCLGLSFSLFFCLSLSRSLFPCCGLFLRFCLGLNLLPSPCLVSLCRARRSRASGAGAVSAAPDLGGSSGSRLRIGLCAGKVTRASND